MILYLATATVLAGLAVYLARLLARRPTLGAAFVLLVIVGLVYDNGVIGLGSAVGGGATLEALSWPRYVIHAFATPLLIFAAYELARRAGAGWAHRSAWRATATLLTLGMIAYGVAFELLPIELVAETADGVTTYVPAEPTGTPIPALVTALWLLVVGVALWFERGWAALALASLVSIVGFGLGPALGLPIVGQVAEVILMTGLVASEAWAQRSEIRTA